MTTDGMYCDLDTGVCQFPGPSVASETEVEAPSRTVASTRITYVTDPICSACWLMEPAWRALTLRYSDLLEVTHVYGGLLPGWDGFADPAAGIRGAEDVAHHWDEMSERSGQPINSGVWTSDPIASSYPPSVAATAVRLTAPDHEERYLRRLRELVFLDERNIARRDVQLEAALSLGLDADALVRAMDDGSAEHEFQHDLVRTRELGARGFPTVIFEGPEGRLTIRGFATLERLEDTFLSVSGAVRRPYVANIERAVELLGTGTSLEYAALLGTSVEDVDRLLPAHGVIRRVVGSSEVWARG